MARNKEWGSLCAILGQPAPWQVKDVAFSTDRLVRSELHLHIGLETGSCFPDEANELCPVQLLVPRITTSDGKVRTVEVPWARPGSGFTLTG